MDAKSCLCQLVMTRTVIDMPEIANCPLCGKKPKRLLLQQGKKEWDAFRCCGYSALTTDLWNRYAAAMELAIATAAYFTLATEAGHKRLQEAGQRVLEVFK